MAVTTTFTVKNLNKVQKALKKYKKSLEDLEEPLKVSGKKAMAALQSYPPYTDSWKSGKPSFSPKRSGTKYKRTGALQKSFHGRIEKKKVSNIRYLVYQKSSENSVEKSDARDYGIYVLAPKQQSPFHRGYWKTTDMWEVEVEKEVEQDFKDWIKKISRK